MDKTKAIAIGKNYKKVVASMFDNPQVYLFGSYSKGTEHEGSDIDVAVVVDGLNGDWMTYSSKLWRATMGVSTLIEPVLIDKTKPSPLYDDVMKDGIKL